MDNATVKTESSISSELLNSAKKRLGSNFWLSLMGVFIYHNYSYFIHIFYSKKEQYCYKYMKWLTDKYIIDGITWKVVWGYLWRALLISLSIYFSSLIFNYFKKLINGFFDAHSNFTVQKKGKEYDDKLKDYTAELILEKERGELEAMRDLNEFNKDKNTEKSDKLNQLSKQLNERETSINNKDERLSTWSKDIESKELALLKEQKEVEVEKETINEWVRKLDAEEKNLTQKRQAIEERKINLDKFDLPKLINMSNSNDTIRRFINNHKDEILNAKIIKIDKMPSDIRKFLESKNMLIDTGDSYTIFNHNGIELFTKYFEHQKS